MRNKIKSSFAIGTLAVLAACGGGGGGVNPYAKAIGGSVIDGYIRNAKVCLDINNNHVCDVGEPSAVTNENGGYAIAYDGSKGDPSGWVVIAEVTENSFDMDDKKPNGDWVSLKDAQKSPFNLAAPVSNSSVLTPLTTLVTHELLSDKAAEVNATTIAAAQETVKTKLGIQDVMGVDYVKDGNQKMLNVAQVVAVALGETTKQLNAELAKKATSDDALKASLTTDASIKSVQNAAAKSVLDMVMPAVMDKDSGTLSTTVQAAKDQSKANVTAVVSGTVNNIVMGTKSGVAKVADSKSLLKNGLVIASMDTFNLYDANQPNGVGLGIDKKSLRMKYVQVDPDTTKVVQVDRGWYQGNWARLADWGSTHALTEPEPSTGKGQWVIDRDVEFNSALRLDKNCVFSSKSNGVLGQLQFCMVERALEGKTILDLNPDLCTASNGYTPPAGCSTAKFKDNAIGLDLTASVTADRYTIDVPNSSNDTWHYGSSFNTRTPAKNIREFMALFVQNMNNVNARVDIWPNFQIRLQSVNADGTEGVLAWYYKDTSITPNVVKEVGTSAIKLLSRKGVDILVFSPVAEYHKQNPGDMTAQDFIFGAKDDKIRLGTVQYANVKQQIDFGVGNWVGNAEMMDSLLSARGIKPFPYAEAR